MPALTIAVPAYNVAPWIADAIQSIQAQTFTDWECIVADDASTDDTVAIARTFAAADPRIRIEMTPTNLGMVANWNRCHSLARTPYFMKLDGDDLLMPETAGRLVAELEAHPEVDSVFCRALRCGPDLKPHGGYQGDIAFEEGGVNPLQRHQRRGRDWYPLAFHGHALWQSSAQAHRTVSMPRYNPQYGCGADVDLILRILERNTPVVHIPYVGVHYRERPGSVSAQYRETGRIVEESILVHLRSLTRQAALWKLPRRLRMVRSRLWRALREHGFAASNIQPPPLRERVVERVWSRLPRG